MSEVEVVKVRIVKPGLVFNGFLEVSPNTTFSELFYQILEEVTKKQREKDLPVQMGSITCGQYGQYVGTRKKNDDDTWIIEVRYRGSIIEEPTVGQMYNNYPSPVFSLNRQTDHLQGVLVLNVFVFNEDRREQHCTPEEDEHDKEYLLPRAKKLKF